MKSLFQKGYIIVHSPFVLKMFRLILGLGSSTYCLAIYPFIVLSKDIHPHRKEYVINHERIHFAQLIETLFIGHFVLAFCEGLYFRFIKRKSGYETLMLHSAEQEAYDNMYDLGYLKQRKHFAHVRKYLVYKPITWPSYHERVLKEEGFAHVFRWTDAPGIVYPAHEHTGKVALYIERGSVIFNFNEKSILCRVGDRIDVPPGVTHRALAGSDGCEFVVGEEIEGDS